MIFPMYAMVLITLFYVGYVGATRVKAAKTGQVDPRYFKAMHGFEVTEKVQITSRHFSNLMETPFLFYIAAGLILVLNLSSAASIAVAWLYVGCRLVHLYIHNTYNHPLHRLFSFLMGLICILVLWTLLVIGVSG